MSRFYGTLSADGGPRGSPGIGRSNLNRTKRGHHEMTATVKTWTTAYRLILTEQGCMLLVFRLDENQNELLVLTQDVTIKEGK